MSAQTQPFLANVNMEGDTAVLALSGLINGEADHALSEAYTAAEQARPRTIRLDFTQVDYINSTGIALIVGLLARARAAHLPLAAAGLNAHYREIFTITRLSDFIDIQ